MPNIIADKLQFENLDYGVYVLGKDILKESTSYDKAGFFRVFVNQVSLPTTDSNIIYLLSDSFEDSLRLTSTKSIFWPMSYRLLYYPIYTIGSYMNKRYKITNQKIFSQRSEMIKKRTRFKPYVGRTLVSSKNNIIFDTSDIYHELSRIGEKVNAKRLLYGFYSEYLRILNLLTPEKYSSKICIIDSTKFNFKQGAPLEKNKTNPLFILYFALFKTRDNSILNIDMDFLIASDKMIMKFNPAKINNSTFMKFKQGLFRIMNSNLDDYMASLSKEEQEEITIDDVDNTSVATVSKVSEIYTKFNSPEVKNTLQTSVATKISQDVASRLKTNEIIKQTQKEVNIHSTVVTKSNEDKKKEAIEKKQMNLFKSVMGSFDPLFTDIEIDSNDDINEDDDIPPSVTDEEEIETYVSNEAIDKINNDKEIAEEIENTIQQRVVPLNSKRNSPINSARDQKLREEQKKIVVKNSTIEEILEKDADVVQISHSDHSKHMTTTNTNMKTSSFTNFDKTYLEKLYSKDILRCFTMLSEKSTPLFVTNIDVKDSSDALYYKETWTVSLVDENNKKHKIVVDIPKFYDNRFMWIKGNRKMILKQNLFLPVVKDTPDTVIITASKKVTLSRVDTQSFTSIQRLFSMIKKLPQNENPFKSGDSSSINTKYISVLEYDEIGKGIFSFETDKCKLYFNREYLDENISPDINVKNNEFFIGYENNIPVIINEDTGLDKNGRTIIEIIYQNMTDKQKAIYDSIKASKRAIYADAKVLGRNIPVAILLIVWVGLKKLLDLMHIQFNIYKDAKKVKKNPNKGYLKLKDAIIEYENSLFVQLVLNGLNKIPMETFTLDQFEKEDCYIEYIRSLWGNYAIKTSLLTTYEFLIDPITKDVCRDINLPQDPVELILYGVKLLADNKYLNKASDKMFRVRSIEAIASILYTVISKQYEVYLKNTAKNPISIPRDIVISNLVAVKTVEDYSTINPATEIGKMSTISSKGVTGSNQIYAYNNEEKRSYDSSSIGKLAMETSNDANVGVNRTLTIEPTITNARGYRSPVEDIEQLKDVNVFSPVEMLTPGTVRNDDPVRSTIAAKQTKHVIPTNESSPALISNGYDEAVQYSLSSDFVVNAEEDGEVVEVNEDVGFVVVKYNSGNSKAINIKPEIVKNGGGGFYLANTLKPAVKLGDKIEKDQVIAYHDKYFTYNKINGLRHNVGPLAKMAFLSSADTYEDAGICTERLSEAIATDIVYKEIATVNRISNINKIVKIGDHVKVGDILLQYDTPYDDSDVMKFLQSLSKDEREIVINNSKNAIKAEHAGEVIDIKVYSLHDPSNLSESLGKVVKKYWTSNKEKEKLLTKYDSTPGIVKAGYLLTGTTKPTISKYNEIKGIKTDVLIEFYISHTDIAGIGDKIVLYGPNKQIISNKIPTGLEPFSEFRPNEEVSVFTSPGTVSRRMVQSVIPVSMTMKIMIELKRKIADMMGIEIKEVFNK